MHIDSVTWGAAAFVLTVLGLAASLLLWRRRGPAAGLRGLAWSLVPLALWLTDTLRLVVDVVDAFLRWGAHLVFSPVVWLGVVVAGLAVLLFVVSGAMRARGVGVRRRGVPQARPEARTPAGERRVGRRSRRPAEDDEMADIQAILDRRGIR